MIKVQKNDVRAICGSNVEFADTSKVLAKNYFNPSPAARWQVGDEIMFSYVNENGEATILVDALRPNAYFTLAALTRGGRDVVVRVYLSTLFRGGLKANGSKHSDDVESPEWVTNTGLPPFIDGQSIVAYVSEIVGKKFKIMNVRETETWGLDFSKIKSEGIDLSAEPRPLRDELWRKGTQRFYDFEEVVETASTATASTTTTAPATAESGDDTH